MSHPKTPLRTGVRVAISLAIVLHLWAVVSPPLGFQTRGPLGSSPSVMTLARPVSGYGEMLYLNRGYAFFAPDPGPSHLIQASYLDNSGKRVETLFPDRTHQWPRLLYHRHFMLTEFLHEIYQPPGPPPELAQVDREAAQLWATARERYENVRQSFTDHLSHVHPAGKEHAIRRLEHRIPSFIEILAEPIPLHDPRMYLVLLDRPLDMPPNTPPGVPAEVLPIVGASEIDLVEDDNATASSEPKAPSSVTDDANVQPLPSETPTQAEPAAQQDDQPAPEGAVTE